jgi:peptidoglycan/xylan/chitin deacetylase (PgdA/CDA1 family)
VIGDPELIHARGGDVGADRGRVFRIVLLASEARRVAHDGRQLAEEVSDRADRGTLARIFAEGHELAMHGRALAAALDHELVEHEGQVRRAGR